MNKQWEEIAFDECPECGSGAEGLTSCKDEGCFYDGDQVRCLERCGETGSVTVDGDTGEGWVSWEGH